MAGTHATEYVGIGGVASRSGPVGFVGEHGLDYRAYTDVETLIAETDLDFLDICTPTHAHLKFVEAAAAVAELTEYRVLDD